MKETQQKIGRNEKLLDFHLHFLLRRRRGESLHLHTRQPETVKKCDQIFLIYWLIKSN
jgi:hypothetical protein